MSVSLSQSDTLRLYSSGLLSKWGFNDGDPPDEFLDWLEKRDPELYDDFTLTCGCGWEPIPWHPILCRLVRERLVPRLNQIVITTEIETSHNPIRALEVDGVDVTDCWYGEPPPPVLTPPEYIEIPYEDVLMTICKYLGEEG